MTTLLIPSIYSLLTLFVYTHSAPLTFGSSNNIQIDSINSVKITFALNS